jgi:hypothetical protein
MFLLRAAFVLLVTAVSLVFGRKGTDGIVDEFRFDREPRQLQQKGSSNVVGGKKNTSIVVSFTTSPVVTPTLSPVTVVSPSPVPTKLSTVPTATPSLISVWTGAPAVSLVDANKTAAPNIGTETGDDTEESDVVRGDNSTNDSSINERSVGSGGMNTAVTAVTVLATAIVSLAVSFVVLVARHRYVQKYGAASTRRRQQRNASSQQPGDTTLLPTCVEIFLNNEEMDGTKMSPNTTMETNEFADVSLESPARDNFLD